MRIGVGTITFNTDLKDLARFARAFLKAAKETGSQHEIFLFYIDNGNPSSLSTLVPFAEMLESEGNRGYTQSINRLMHHAFENRSLDAFISANPDGAFHFKAIKN